MEAVNKEATPDTPVISIREVSRIFKSKKGTVTALDKVSLDIRRGEIFGIIGMSGAGKSTLVRTMNFLEKPTSGEVEVLGQILSRLSRIELNAIRKKTAMIFQNFNLLMQKTVIDNVCFPLIISGVSKTDARATALDLLRLVGLEEKAHAYPAQLSGGQKQRVAIARALSTKPEILLCDEATSALDPQSTASILEILRDINRDMGITIVVITHQMSVVKEICTRVAIMDQGRVVETGPVLEVFIKPHSETGRRIIFDGTSIPPLDSDRRIRVVFEGEQALKPIIASIIKDVAPVSILFADVQNTSQGSAGQAVLELPEDEGLRKRIFAYLREQGLYFEGKGGHVYTD